MGELLVTDDASLIEHLCHSVKLTEGEYKYQGDPPRGHHCCRGSPPQPCQLRPVRLPTVCDQEHFSCLLWLRLQGWRQSFVQNVLGFHRRLETVMVLDSMFCALGHRLCHVT